METFYTFCKNHLVLSQDAKEFIEENRKIIEGKKYEYYSTEDENKEYWCFVLEGLVAGHSYNENGDRTIHWVIEPCSYFTGSKHLFSDTSPKQNIEFLQPSRILQIPKEKMRYAQEHLPSINELIQILKQHKILEKDRLINILNQPNDEALYFKFMDEMKSIANLLTAQQVMDLLKLKRTTYVKIRKAYSKNRY